MKTQVQMNKDSVTNDTTGKGQKEEVIKEIKQELDAFPSPAETTGCRL